MSVIYLAAGYAVLNHSDVVYQDKFIKRDLGGDMLDIDLKEFDVVIASPPCNFYSRARGNQKPSKYAVATRHLLPSIIKKLIDLEKPFIVENVRNFPLFKKLGFFDFDCFVYFIGRHTYWTNCFINLSNVKQPYDFTSNGKCISDNRQGGKNVNDVFNYFLELVL